MKVNVVDYQNSWELTFKDEADRMKQTFDEECLKLFHIGSTSVPGLQAKPIIDMLFVAKDIEKLDQYAYHFETLGYEVMGEFGIKGRRYYRKGTKERTHQIHAFQYDNVYEIVRHVTFRDYLRENEHVRKSYGALKQKLAQEFPNDIESYMDGKDRFIKQVEKDALIWHWNQ